ncbi:outer membrane usher protein FimD [Acinetobacter sp.]|uniref:outer membrane usher protein FimD n=1 Tax=Acinetobacter sp. TaxID=472 RepID=UPI003340B0FA
MYSLQMVSPDPWRFGQRLKTLPLCVLVAMSASVTVSEDAFAKQVFNPAFLKDDLSNSQISDLSKFEDSSYQMPGIYRVEVVANDQAMFTRDVNFIEKTDAENKSRLFPCFDMKTLESFGINIAAYEKFKDVQDQRCVDFTSIIEGADTTFIFDKQKLIVSLPQAALKNQIRGYIPPEQWEEGINGLFLNYSLSGYNSSKTDSNGLFLGIDTGLNIGSWQLRHSGSWNQTSSLGNSTHEWNSLRTYVQKTLIPIKSNLLLGDGFTSNEIFDSFGFRGAHLSTANEMYPDSQQGYAPTVRGVAKTNARVVIKQNGFIIQQSNVAPGPFVIADLNPTSISGDLHVSIEENDGTVQSYTVPYSSLPILQREGRTKYSVMAGEFRSGRKSQGNPKVFQATLSHGLKKGISVYAGTQIADDYTGGVVGVGSNLGNYGAVSFDVSHANSTLVDGSKHSGQSVRFLYSKSLLKTGTTFQLLGYRYSTKGFYTLNDVAYSQMSGYNYSETHDGNQGIVPVITDYYNLSHPKKGRFEVNLSHSFGQYGSIYASGNQQTYWGTNDKNEWLQAGYANNWKGVNYSFSMSRNKMAQVNETNNMFMANVSFPLARAIRKAKFEDPAIGNLYGNFSTNQNTNGSDTYLAGLSGTLLKDRNLSFSMNQGHASGQGNTSSLNVNYSGTYGNIGGGYSYDANSDRFSYNASGGVLAHQDGVTFGQPVGDTAILVKAPGAAGVRLENYTGVKTDWRGYAIVPYATEYRMNRVALDTNSFSNNLEISNNVDTVVPIKGAITRATFKPSLGLRALVTLKYQGRPVAYASSVTEAETSAYGVVAEDGAAYMTGLPVKGTLKVNWGAEERQNCAATYDISSMDLNQAVLQFELDCR